MFDIVYPITFNHLEYNGGGVHVQVRDDAQCRFQAKLRVVNGGRVEIDKDIGVDIVAVGRTDRGDAAQTIQIKQQIGRSCGPKHLIG